MLVCSLWVYNGQQQKTSSKQKYNKILCVINRILTKVSKQASKQKIDNKHTQKNRKFRFNWILVINEPPKKQKKNQLYACKIHTHDDDNHTQNQTKNI